MERVHEVHQPLAGKRDAVGSSLVPSAVVPSFTEGDILVAGSGEG